MDSKSAEYIKRSEQAAADIATWPQWMQNNLTPPRVEVAPRDGDALADNNEPTITVYKTPALGFSVNQIIPANVTTPREALKWLQRYGRYGHLTECDVYAWQFDTNTGPPKEPKPCSCGFVQVETQLESAVSFASIDEQL